MQYPKKSIKKTGKALLKEKEIAFSRDKHRCQICDRHLFFADAWFHHIILKSQLVLDVADNLLTVCKWTPIHTCHSDIHLMQNGQSTGLTKEKYWDRVRRLVE